MLLEPLLARRRVVLTSALFLAVLGTFAWLFMPREEDPRMPDRFGLIVTTFPGADATQVERLVLEPIEEHLGEVELVKKITATARANVAVVNVELHDHVTDTGSAWDEVERGLDEARGQFPSGVAEPELDRDLLETESIVLAITGSHDRLVLARAAEDLKKELLALPEVAKVVKTADPEEQVTIEYEDAVARRVGLDARQLSGQLAAKNSAVPGGTIKVGERRANLRPNSEFASMDEIAATAIALPSGASLPLRDVARVRLTELQPASSSMRHNGSTAVAIGVVPHKNVNVVEFGAAIRARLDGVRSRFAPLRIDEVVFQPDRVERRLGGLGRSLLVGILIVAGVLVGFMGLRLGLLVASVVPLVAMSSLAIYAMGGGLLQQISIAALVLALGMLVDNAIVIAEGVQRRLDDGMSRRDAVTRTVGELAVPLAAATGTTLAAFVPMLLSKGPTGDFTRSIPVVLMLSLSISYVFAVLVTPVLSGMFLRKSRSGGEASWLDRVARSIGRLAVTRRRWVAFAATALVVGSGLAVGGVERRFFPRADRNQLVVSLELPEGAHLEEIDARARKVEAALIERDDVAAVTAFVGRSTPRFYYNLLRRPSSPHLAQLLVTTTQNDDVATLTQWVRDHVRQEHPELEIVARPLEQGPPVNAPIEVRVQGNHLRELSEAADAVLAELRRIEGARDVRHNLGVGVPSLRYAVDDSVASRYGATRTDVALAMLGRTRGLEVGQLRAGADPVPIVIRAAAGEDTSAAELETLDVARPGAPPIPLAQVAQASVEWQPAVIQHHQRQRSVSVLAELADGVPFSRVLAELGPRIDALELPDGVEVSYGGAAEGSGQANTALLTAVPIGMFLLLFILLAEFNSFRRLGIVLVTVPLAATGVVPGLLLSGQPFGFMSMLGVFALVGIVVNNAIVLLDVADRRLEEGAAPAEAASGAVVVRTRPILLTTITTVAGLLPLALSSTSLWPPLAWAMISGLVASTVLTLLVVPALYASFVRGGERPPSVEAA